MGNVQGATTVCNVVETRTGILLGSYPSSTQGIPWEPLKRDMQQIGGVDKVFTDNVKGKDTPFANQLLGVCQANEVLLVCNHPCYSSSFSLLV